MFFIKLAFWLGVAVLLLPTDAQQQARLYTTATSAVERATTFCDRNPATCTAAASAWTTFLKKAEFGARLMGDLISSSGRQAPDASQPPRQNTSEPRGTLSSTDMQPAWRGPSARRTGT
jgi:hypothetical protein